MRTVSKKKAETLPAQRETAPPPAVHDPKRFRRFGNVGIKDMEIPTLALLQKMSKVLEQDHSLRAGSFYHSILEQDLGRELAEVVVLLVHHSVVLKTPKDPRGGLPQILARAADGHNWDKPNTRFEVVYPGGRKGEYFTGKNVQHSGLMEWGSSDPENRQSVPAASDVYTVILRLLNPAVPGPVIYTGSVTTNRKIRELNSKVDLRALGGVEPLRQIYTLSAEEKQGAQGGIWYVPNFAPNGELPEGDPRFDEYMAQAERLDALYPSIKAVGAEPLDDEIPAAGANNRAF